MKGRFVLADSTKVQSTTVGGHGGRSMRQLATESTIRMQKMNSHSLYPFHPSPRNGIAQMWGGGVTMLC